MIGVVVLLLLTAIGSIAVGVGMVFRDRRRGTEATRLIAAIRAKVELFDEIDHVLAGSLMPLLDEFERKAPPGARK